MTSSVANGFVPITMTFPEGQTFEVRIGPKTAFTSENPKLHRGMNITQNVSSTLEALFKPGRCVQIIPESEPNTEVLLTIFPPTVRDCKEIGVQRPHQIPFEELDLHRAENDLGPTHSICHWNADHWGKYKKIYSVASLAMNVTIDDDNEYVANVSFKVARPHGTTSPQGAFVDRDDDGHDEPPPSFCETYCTIL